MRINNPNSEEKAPSPRLPQDSRENPRRRVVLVLGTVGTVALLIGATAYFLASGDPNPPVKVSEIKIVAIVPPPPPPPPPPPEQKPPEEKVVEQQTIEEPEVVEEKPVEEPKEAPADEPPSDEPPATGPLGMDAAGEGPGDLFNLAGRPGASGFGYGGGGGGTRWAAYVGFITSRIEAALRESGKTKNQTGQAQVRIWSSASGRIERIQLVSVTAGTGYDAASLNAVLIGLVMQPPPADMPMPIITRITGRKPG